MRLDRHPFVDACRTGKLEQVRSMFHETDSMIRQYGFRVSIIVHQIEIAEYFRLENVKLRPSIGNCFFMLNADDFDRDCSLVGVHRLARDTVDQLVTEGDERGAYDVTRLKKFIRLGTYQFSYLLLRTFGSGADFLGLLNHFVYSERRMGILMGRAIDRKDAMLMLSLLIAGAPDPVDCIARGLITGKSTDSFDMAESWAAWMAVPEEIRLGFELLRVARFTRDRALQVEALVIVLPFLESGHESRRTMVAKHVASPGSFLDLLCSFKLNYIKQYMSYVMSVHAFMPGFSVPSAVFEDGDYVCSRCCEALSSGAGVSFSSKTASLPSGSSVASKR